MRHTKYLSLLVMGFTLCLVMANWFDARLIQLFGFINTDAGTLVFPLTFILGDIITEVYGFKNTRRTIWIGFVGNFLFLAYGQLVIHLPSPAYAVAHNHMFDQLLYAEARIVIASFIAYFVAEPLDAYCVAKTKILFKGRYMAARFLGSMVCASAIGSIVFTVIAFWGTMPMMDLLILMLTMWLIKIAVELIMLPVAVWYAHVLKRAEHLDVYDDHTDFSLLKLGTEYQRSANRFKTSATIRPTS